MLAGSYETDPVTGATVEPPAGGAASSVRDFLAGILICSMALFIIMYGLGVYLWRLRKLARRDTHGYADPFGPPVVVTATFVAVIMYITVHVRDTLDDTAAPSPPAPTTVLGPAD